MWKGNHERDLSSSRVSRLCLPVRCAADRGRAWSVEPGGPGPPGLWEHPDGPAGVQRCQPGDPRCEKPATTSWKLCLSWKTCIIDPVIISLIFPQAIQNPNDFKHQERAWNSVCPLVIKLKNFYSFSIRLGLDWRPPSAFPGCFTLLL